MQKPKELEAALKEQKNGSSSTTPIPSVDEKRIERIEARLDAANLYEGKAYKVVFSGIVGLILLTAGTNYFQTGRLDNAESDFRQRLESFEARSAALLGAHIPEGAEIVIQESLEASLIRGNASLAPTEVAGQRIYALQLVIPFAVRVQGESPGKILGYSYSLPPELDGIASDFVFSEDSGQSEVVDASNRYQPIGQTGGVLPANVPINFSVARTYRLEDCARAASLMEMLVSQQRFNDFEITPYFEHIVSPPAGGNYAVHFDDQSWFNWRGCIQ